MAGFNIKKGMNLDGVVETQIQLRRLRANLKSAGLRGVKKATKYLMREAKKVTPKLTGDLKNSAKDTYTTINGEAIGRIGYHTYYAIWVHEDLEKNHKAGTYAKYLERTMRNRQHIKNARTMIANEILIEEKRIIKNTNKKFSGNKSRRRR